MKGGCTSNMKSKKEPLILIYVKDQQPKALDQILQADAAKKLAIDTLVKVAFSYHEGYTN